MKAVRAWLKMLGGRHDLAIVLLLVVSILLMIIPLPTALIDLALASNMGITVLLLMVAVYVRNPLDFSMLPSIILLATIFRLALSIATTRLILVQADAGEIVETFGEFVVAGNLIVGLVVFLIITIVQFVVITKGSERVAEVSARFTLDALPGKQMSIDAELRSGEIDQKEARTRRQLLENESQLYGAMDGAMKFVKGDAIAGLIIIAVNLLGGIAVGTVQENMAIGEALHVYSTLTVGDGLVAQIPALFVALAAGVVVTRVTTEESTDLGSDIVRQVMSEPRAAMVAAGLLFGLAFIPGFPAPVFVMLAAALGGIALMMRMRQRARHREGPAEADRRLAGSGSIVPRLDGNDAVREQPAAQPVAEERLALILHPKAEAALDIPFLAERVRSVTQEIADWLGMPAPVVGLGRDAGIQDSRFRIDIDGVPITGEAVPLGSLCVTEKKADLDLLEIEAEPGPELGNGHRGHWVDTVHLRALDEAGFSWLGPEEMVAERLATTFRRQAAQFFGLRETKWVLTRAEERDPELVREIATVLSVQRMTDIYRRLINEGVSIRPQRIILEALLELTQREQDVTMLAEYVRSALARQICFAYANEEKVISVLLLERSLEETLRASIKQSAVGSFLTLSDRTRRRFLDLVRLHTARVAEGDAQAVLLTSLDVRRFVRQLFARNDIHVPVLAHSEIARDFVAQPVTTLRLGPHSTARRRAPQGEGEADERDAA